MANTPTGGRAVGDADRHSSEPGSDPSALTAEPIAVTPGSKSAVAWAVRFVIEKQWASASRDVVGAGAAGGPLRRSVGSPSSRSRPAVLVVRVACLTHGRVAEPREAVVARPAPPQHIKPRLLSHWVLA